MKVRITQAFTGQPVEVRGVDLTTERTEIGIAQVVAQDDDHVRRGPAGGVGSGGHQPCEPANVLPTRP